MIKLVGMVRKRADLTHAEFRDYWLRKHALLEAEVLAAGHVSRIVATFWQENMIGEAPFDGMVELYFESAEALQRSFEAGIDDRMIADEANFCDPDYRVFFRTDEIDIGAHLASAPPAIAN